jgi:putative hemolysin
MPTSPAPLPAPHVRSLPDGEVFPHFPDAIPPGALEVGRYRLRFAWQRADLRAVQRLRYRVFTEELGEGLPDNDRSGLDVDERDHTFHHLMIETLEGEVVGTYRLQTAVMAATGSGFYGGTLFELATMPTAVLADAVEIGRACVAPAHRSGRVLRLLWRGLARYLQWSGKRYLFGCCSLTGTAPALARDGWAAVLQRGALHPDILVRPRPATRALADDGRVVPEPGAVTVLPPLFEGYLALGAHVCGPPAVDRAFGTTDFVVLLDTQALDARTYASFFGTA